jgi:hypothetical protein
MPCKPYVRSVYTHFTDPKVYFDALCAQLGKPTFLEGLVFGEKSFVLISGEFADAPTTDAQKALVYAPCDPEHKGVPPLRWLAVCRFCERLSGGAVRSGAVWCGVRFGVVLPTRRTHQLAGGRQHRFDSGAAVPAPVRARRVVDGRSNGKQSQSPPLASLFGTLH